MSAQDKTELLRSFLGNLPPDLAVRVAEAVKLDRVNDGRALPHDLILESLRPALRTAEESERMPTPLGAFCRPFEDLLVDGPRPEKQKGRIARSSVNAVWNWLAQTLVPEPLSSYCIAMKTAVPGYRTGEMRMRTAAFWKTASQAIHRALGTESGMKAARQMLGSAAAAEDAREIAIMLNAGEQIGDLQLRLPPTLPSLTDGIVRAFRAVYDRVVECAPDAAPYLPLLVMRRLERPWEALRLPLSISRKTQETLIASTDMGLVGELILADIETHGAAVRLAKPQQLNADSLVSDLERFTTLIDGMVKEVDLRRDGKWGQRLLKDRAAVSEAMEALMVRAPKEIYAAIPMVKSGTYAGGPRIPDLSKPADPEKVDRAFSYARLIAGCRRIAAVGSFASALKAADNEIGVALKDYNDQLVRELRSAAESGQYRHGERYVSVAVELTAILFSPEEGDFMRRRGRAALRPAAA